MRKPFHCQHCAKWLRLDFGIFEYAKQEGVVTLAITCPRCGGETPVEIRRGPIQEIKNLRTVVYEAHD